MKKFYFIFCSSKGSKDLIYIDDVLEDVLSVALNSSSVIPGFIFRVYATDGNSSIFLPAMKPVATFRNGLEL